MGKGHFYALIEHLAFHIRALIATAEPENCAREPFLLPLKGHRQGGGIKGPEGASSPKIQTPKMCPFSK